MAQAGNGAPKVELTVEQIFEKAAKNVAARAREINASVKTWANGESELEDLILEMQLGQRKLAKAMQSLAAARQALPQPTAQK